MYELWVDICHPSARNSLDIGATQREPSVCTLPSTCDLSDILVLPEKRSHSAKRKKSAVNNSTVCLTDQNVLCQLKEEEKKKEKAKIERVRKKKEREEKKKEREKEREKKKKEKEKKKEKKINRRKHSG